ncbi:unnamed protein product [Symbiodinium sp. CCMP2592]|nr:unnamed protein product [Symbiodinium sp. CCMP2592]
MARGQHQDVGGVGDGDRVEGEVAPVGHEDAGKGLLETRPREAPHDGLHRPVGEAAQYGRNLQPKVVLLVVEGGQEVLLGAAIAPLLEGRPQCRRIPAMGRPGPGTTGPSTSSAWTRKAL